MEKKYSFNKDDMNRYFADLSREIISSFRGQLINQGHKYYCPYCSTMEKFIASDIQEPCSKCNNELISLDNFK